ncbi:hypothetical protein HK405_001568, partial [Cladochytrium tenue]
MPSVSVLAVCIGDTSTSMTSGTDYKLTMRLMDPTVTQTTGFILFRRNKEDLPAH